MMHAVQPPEPRHFVKPHMLGIDRKIQRDEAEQDFRARRATA